MAERETWATRTGFILAAVGSAVGLGNVWRFPYQVGEQGGAGFLLVYLLLIAFVGFPVMLVEFTVGRYTDRNPVGALKAIGGGISSKIGWVFVVAGFVILSYYSVVSGWILQYTIIGLQGNYAAGGAGAQFGATTGGITSVVTHALFMAAVIGIVAFGIKRGIEFSVKLMVPAIMALLIGLAVYAATLSGAGEAYAYYLSPDLGTIAANWTEILPAAAAQAFFTLSLGMGVMITYASYLGEDRNLGKDGAIIVGLDTAIAIIVGLVAFPVLMTVGVDPESAGAGPGFIFISLAEAFGGLPFGGIIGAIFFATVLIAALSSAISIMEVVVSYLIDERGIDRVPATAMLGTAIFLLGVPVAYDQSEALVWLTVYDGFANNILLILGGLLLSIYVGWVVTDIGLEELGKGVQNLGTWGLVWIWALRIPVIVILVVILVLNGIGYLETLSGLFG